jgi:glycosyltransferase involved in cell wall biosynthesis
VKIAQVAPLIESLPPRGYGGVERIVYYLTEELVRLGHDVTVYANGESTTSAKQELVWPTALRVVTRSTQRDAAFVLLLEEAFGDERFDIIHSHLDFLAFPLARRCLSPVLTTVHGHLNLPELQAVYSQFPDLPLVSVSEAQRLSYPTSNWVRTIYHGLPAELYSFHPGPGRYLAFLGRISPEKQPDSAIAVARRTGVPLRIAAKIDPVDQEYFDKVIRPALADPLVEFVGEITDTEKNAFLGEALAVLCPFTPEAFGLVLVEALACGTPVIAYRHGSFLEIIDEGVTGFLCPDAQGMVDAVHRLQRIDRRQCRATFEKRFTLARMVREYLEVYQLIKSGRKPPGHEAKDYAR